jgi:hypothetical protein
LATANPAGRLSAMGGSNWCGELAQRSSNSGERVLASPKELVNAARFPPASARGRATTGAGRRFVSESAPPPDAYRLPA